MEVDPETHDSNHQDPHSADMAEGRGVDTDATNGAAADVTDLEECVDTEGGVEDTDMVSVDEESNNEEFDVLGCQQCKFPISHATDILMEKAEAIGPTVYHYDLDLDMVNTEIPCYSSDNPSGMRFDVVRVWKLYCLEEGIQLFSVEKKFGIFLSIAMRPEAFALSDFLF